MSVLMNDCRSSLVPSLPTLSFHFICRLYHPSPFIFTSHLRGHLLHMYLPHYHQKGIIVKLVGHDIVLLTFFSWDSRSFDHMVSSPFLTTYDQNLLVAPYYLCRPWPIVGFMLCKVQLGLEPSIFGDFQGDQIKLGGYLKFTPWNLLSWVSIFNPYLSFTSLYNKGFSKGKED
jgi:hypothetical protein